jgi:hypothetical protein
MTTTTTDLNEIVNVTMENGTTVKMLRGTFNDAMRLGLHAFVVRVGRTVRPVAFRSYAGRSFDDAAIVEDIRRVFQEYETKTVSVIWASRCVGIAA